MAITKLTFKVPVDFGGKDVENLKTADLDLTLSYDAATQDLYLKNGAGAQIGDKIHITSGGVITEDDPTFKASVAYGITAGNIASWNDKSDFSGSYDDLTDKPTIPSVEGLASETYVSEMCQNVEDKIPSLDGYATTEYVESLDTNLKNHLSTKMNEDDWTREFQYPQGSEPESVIGIDADKIHYDLVTTTSAYQLDEEGNEIFGEDGTPISVLNTVHTTVDLGELIKEYYYFKQATESEI